MNKEDFYDVDYAINLSLDRLELENLSEEEKENERRSLFFFLRDKYEMTFGEKYDTWMAEQYTDGTLEGMIADMIHAIDKNEPIDFKSMYKQDEIY